MVIHSLMTMVKIWLFSFICSVEIENSLFQSLCCSGIGRLLALHGCRCDRMSSLQLRNVLRGISFNPFREKVRSDRTFGGRSSKKSASTARAPAHSSAKRHQGTSNSAQGEPAIQSGGRLTIAPRRSPMKHSAPLLTLAALAQLHRGPLLPPGSSTSEASKAVTRTAVTRLPRCPRSETTPRTGTTTR